MHCAALRDLGRRLLRLRGRGGGALVTAAPGAKGEEGDECQALRVTTHVDSLASCVQRVMRPAACLT